MDIVNIGSFAVSIRNLVPAAAILASVGVGSWFRRYRGIEVNSIVWKVIIGTLISARVGFVLSHFDIYAGSPLDLLDIRDGGLLPTAGMFAAFVIGAELTRRSKDVRGPLVTACVVGTVVWLVGDVATLDFNPAHFPVPVVEVKRLDGNPVQLRTMSDKPLIINLWASWCPPCRREMPILRDAQARHPDVDFVFLNQGESPDTISRYLAGEDLKLKNVLVDRMGEVGKKTNSVGLPTTLFFDKDGILFYRQVGELSAAALDKQLARLGAAKR